ncbi:MAG: hypothetical protein B7Z37_07845, partial [Verrucomicrobia bacterium 12-59-8]
MVAGAFFGFVVFFVVALIYQIASRAKYVSGDFFLGAVFLGGVIGFLIPFSEEMAQENARKIAAEAAAKARATADEAEKAERKR